MIVNRPALLADASARRGVLATALSGQAFSSGGKKKKAPGAEAAGEVEAIVVVTGTRVRARTRPRSRRARRRHLDPGDHRSGNTELAQALSVALPSLNFTRPAVTDGTDTIRPASPCAACRPTRPWCLVNSKRQHASTLVNLNGSSGLGAAAVDLNYHRPPPWARSRVLRDGASAQYGSDAHRRRGQHPPARSPFGREHQRHHRRVLDPRLLAAPRRRRSPAHRPADQPKALHRRPDHDGLEAGPACRSEPTASVDRFWPSQGPVADTTSAPVATRARSNTTELGKPSIRARYTADEDHHWYGDAADGAVHPATWNAELTSSGARLYGWGRLPAPGRRPHFGGQLPPGQPAGDRRQPARGLSLNKATCPRSKAS